MSLRETDRAWGKEAPSALGSPPAELQAQYGLRTFRLARTCCYEALLVDEERGRLFVGAENHVASLSLDNISKRAKKVQAGLAALPRERPREPTPIPTPMPGERGWAPE